MSDKTRFVVIYILLMTIICIECYAIYLFQENMEMLKQFTKEFNDYLTTLYD